MDIGSNIAKLLLKAALFPSEKTQPAAWGKTSVDGEKIGVLERNVIYK